MINFFVGVDNGLNGGIVVIDRNQKIIGYTVMPVVKGKKTEYDVRGVIDFFNNLVEPSEVFVALEKAHVRPISGKRASFMTGFGYGLMQGLIESFGFSYEIVSPKDWQGEILKGINTGDTKKDSIMFCKRKWPKHDWTATEKSKKAHDGLTDAAALSLYGFRKNG